MILWNLMCIIVFQEFNNAFLGVNQRNPRWVICVREASASKNRLGFAAGAMFIRKHANRSSKKVALEMVAKIHSSFEQLLKSNDWMDSETKNNALEKVYYCFCVLKLFKNLKIFHSFKLLKHIKIRPFFKAKAMIDLIYFPDFIFDDKQLDDEYKGVSF